MCRASHAPRPGGALTRQSASSHDSASSAARLPGAGPASAPTRPGGQPRSARRWRDTRWPVGGGGRGGGGGAWAHAACGAGRHARMVHAGAEWRARMGHAAGPGDGCAETRWSSGAPPRLPRRSPPCRSLQGACAASHAHEACAWVLPRGLPACELACWAQRGVRCVRRRQHSAQPRCGAGRRSRPAAQRAEQQEVMQRLEQRRGRLIINRAGWARLLVRWGAPLEVAAA